MADWSNYLFLFGIAAIFALHFGAFDSASESDDPEQPDDDGSGQDSGDFLDRISGAAADAGLSADPYHDDLAYLLSEANDASIAGWGDPDAGNADAAEGWGPDDEDDLADTAWDDETGDGTGAEFDDGTGSDFNLFGDTADDSQWVAEDQAEDVPPETAGDDGNMFMDAEDGDTSAPAGGADIFTIYEIRDADAAAAHVGEFDSATDALQIHYYPSTDPETGELATPEITITYNSLDDVTTVSLNGQAIAMLDGDVAITPDDIVLTAVA